MERKPSLESSLRKSLQKKRGEMNLADFQLTTSHALSPGQLLPLVIEPAIAGVNLASWASNNREYLGRELAKHGALLFHNFAVDSPAKFEAFARAVSADGDLFDEYGDLPREQPGAKVYGSTPYPADKAILFHNESSHWHRWPMKIFSVVSRQLRKGARHLFSIAARRIRRLILRLSSV